MQQACQVQPELERVLSVHFGVETRIARLRSEPSAYHSSYRIHNLTVDLEDGRRLDLVCKELGAAALLERARKVKPDFMHNPLREIAAYRRILAPRGLGARFFGAAIDRSAARYRLYLENVAATPLWEIGEFAIWRQVAVWLATFHAAWPSPVTANGPAVQRRWPYVCYDRHFYERWLSRARAFARPDNATLRRGVDSVLLTYARCIERLLAMPVSLIHGDFYASNVLVGTEASARICPVDWELTGVGPPLMDLAALVAGHWTEDQKADLARAYHAGWTAGHSIPPSWDERQFRADLDCARLHVAVQWLGWSPNWAPPAEHAQDWLAEAIQVAERLNA